MTGLPKCPRCGSIISGPHQCSTLGMSGSGAAPKTSPPKWCAICQCYDSYCLHALLRRAYERTGELIAKLDRAYKEADLGGGVAESNAPVAPGEVQESRPAAPAESCCGRIDGCDDDDCAECNCAECLSPDVKTRALEFRVDELTAERDQARAELAQAHANIDQLLGELKRQ